MAKRSDQIAALRAQGCNCCQVVLRAFEDQVDVSREALMRFGAGFGGGMGCMEATCGALVGAGMAAGWLTSGRGTARVSAQVLTKFRSKCGATLCKDLKGRDTGKVLCPCDDCVRNAVAALSETLGL